MSRRKVLLVDDSPIVRAVVAHALTAAGLEVKAIDHPSALAEAVLGTQPDVLLVDASYPGVTDDMLVELVTPHARVLPVVLFSDRAAAEIALLGARIGARGSIPKDGATLAERLAPFLAS